MKKIRFAVVGSGWRSLFYGRIAQALPERFVKYMWPMMTLATAFDSLVYLIARAFLKYSPEDSDKVEALLKERRAEKERAARERVSVSAGEEDNTNA